MRQIQKRTNKRILKANKAKSNLGKNKPKSDIALNVRSKE